VQLARVHGLDASERIDVAGPVWIGVVAVAADLDASVIVVARAGRPLPIVPPAAGCA
jgi:hypothetical protein